MRNLVVIDLTVLEFFFMTRSLCDGQRTNDKRRISLTAIGANALLLITANVAVIVMLNATIGVSHNAVVHSPPPQPRSP